MCGVGIVGRAGRMGSGIIGMFILLTLILGNCGVQGQAFEAWMSNRCFAINGEQKIREVYRFAEDSAMKTVVIFDQEGYLEKRVRKNYNRKGKLVSIEQLDRTELKKNNPNGTVITFVSELNDRTQRKTVSKTGTIGVQMTPRSKRKFTQYLTLKESQDTIFRRYCFDAEGQLLEQTEQFCKGCAATTRKLNWAMEPDQIYRGVEMSNGCLPNQPCVRTRWEVLPNPKGKVEFGKVTSNKVADPFLIGDDVSAPYGPLNKGTQEDDSNTGYPIVGYAKWKLNPNGIVSKYEIKKLSSADKFSVFISQKVTLLK